MPLIQVKLLNQAFTDVEKSNLISKLTEAMASVKGEHIRQVTWVLIEDVPSGQWGVGGHRVTLDDTRAFAALDTRSGILS